MEDPTPITVTSQPSSSAVENNGEVESNMQKKTTTTKKMSKMVKARRELSPLRDKMALFEGDGGAKQIDEAARKKSSERARSVSPVPQRLKGDALSPFVATANNKQKLSNGNGNRNNLSPTRSKLNTTDALLDSPFDNNNKGDDNMSQDNGQPTDSIEPPLGMEKEVGNDDEYVAVVSLDDKEEEEEQQQLVSEEIKEEEEVEEVEHVAAIMDRQNSEEEEEDVEIDVTVVEGSSQPPVVGEEEVIKRIPKRSAILARDSPERDIYIQQRIQQKLETWNNNKDTKWHIRQYTFDGYSISETKVEEHITIKLSSLEDTIETFYKDPEKYIAMYYNKEIVNGATPNDDVSFTVTYVVRAGTTGYKPDDLRTDNTGRFVIYQHVYKRLPSMKDDILPLEYRDEYTDKMTYLGKLLHTTNVDEKNDNNDDGCTTIIVNNNKPIMPGRGMGIADTANMKLFGDDGASPNDIFQGDVIGDCWLLSAIACLADFDFAVKRLFRKTTTADLGNLPQDEPNQYTITLWDLNTWNEVDIVVDERLPVRGDGSGFLLGAKPSHEGLLWVPYLEKAIAIHCGGYDKLEGGCCTNAWPMMTGSRNQFIISKNPDTSLYRCMARYNAKEKKWTDHSNSPHDSDQNVWSVDWPKVGGGGIMGSEITAEDLYNRIVAWDKTNYLIGAGTDGWSDKESTDGIVDNHAYSVIDSQRNICGTGIDLLLIRNPWGKGGELQNGEFMRHGPGWDRFPEIKEELKPIMDDNGLCWVTKEEFFQYFPTIYLCAFNMNRLQEDGDGDDNYINDLQNDFEDLDNDTTVFLSSKQLQKIDVNKESDPSSNYKVVEEIFDGCLGYGTLKEDSIQGTSIAMGIEEFKNHPETYLAMHYQTSIVTDGWPEEMHTFKYIYRKGTTKLKVKGVSDDGKRTILTNVLR